MREEIFGPVLPIVVVDSEQEAIDLANDSEFGLGASVWTKDRQKGERIARRIESGMVWINDHSFSHGACQCAWGGVKDSGVGRSHSKFGFYECVNIKMNAWEPGLDPRLLVAPLRPHPRRGGPGLGEDPLRQGRDPRQGAARGRRPAAQGRPAHPARSGADDFDRTQGWQTRDAVAISRRRFRPSSRRRRGTCRSARGRLGRGLDFGVDHGRDLDVFVQRFEVGASSCRSASTSTRLRTPLPFCLRTTVRSPTQFGVRRT